MEADRSQPEFLGLIKANQGIIHKICRLYAGQTSDQEDLYQEVIVQLWKSFSSFRGDSKFSTWIYRVALNTAISHQRKKNRSVSIHYSDKDLPDQPDAVKGEEEEQLNQLYKAIAQLGEIEKALVMLYLDDRSYEEMEEIMGINQNNLRVKMNRIKEKLRKLTKEVEYGIG